MQVLELQDPPMDPQLDESLMSEVDAFADGTVAVRTKRLEARRIPRIRMADDFLTLILFKTSMASPPWPNLLGIHNMEQHATCYRPNRRLVQAGRPREAAGRIVGPDELSQDL